MSDANDESGENVMPLPETGDHKDERGFLHDISSPLAVGQGNLRIIISKLQTDPPAIGGEALLEKLRKVQTAVDKIVTLVTERRKVVRGNDPGGAKADA